MKRKGLAIAGLVAGLSALTSMSAFAGEWKQDYNGWWWQNDDGSYPVSTWQWLDGNKDGLSESYYFNEAGYLVTNTTIDGYTVNADGAWTENGQIQIKKEDGVNKIEFVDFSEYFDTELNDRNTLAKHFGWGDVEGDSWIKDTALTTFGTEDLHIWDINNPGRYTFGFERFSNGEYDTEISYIEPHYNLGLSGLITGLSKKSYSIEEMEEIVKEAGATNINKTVNIDKRPYRNISANGGMTTTDEYWNSYHLKLEFDYNGMRYTLLNVSQYSSLISGGTVRSIK